MLLIASGWLAKRFRGVNCAVPEKRASECACIGVLDNCNASQHLHVAHGENCTCADGRVMILDELQSDPKEQAVQSQAIRQSDALLVIASV